MSEQQLFSDILKETYFVNMFELKQYNEELFVAHNEPMYSECIFLPEEWQDRMAELAFMTGRVEEAAAIESQTLPLQTLRLLSGVDMYLMSLSCAYRKIPGSCRTEYLKDNTVLWQSLSAGLVTAAIYARAAAQLERFSNNRLNKSIKNACDYEDDQPNENRYPALYARYRKCYQDALVPGYDKNYPNAYANPLCHALDAIYNPRVPTVNMLEVYSNITDWITMETMAADIHDMDDVEILSLRSAAIQARNIFRNTTKYVV